MDDPKPTRFRRRIERAHKAVPILSLLERLGFGVRGDEARPQQFRCSLHGDGSDSKPSAKAYPDTNLWHCFACPRTRNTVATVEAALHLDRFEAVKWLEATYGLPPLPFEPDEPPPEPIPETLVREPPSPERLRGRAERFLRNLAAERAAPFEVLALEFEALDLTPDDRYELEGFLDRVVSCSW